MEIDSAPQAARRKSQWNLSRSSLLLGWTTVAAFLVHIVLRVLVGPEHSHRIPLRYEFLVSGLAIVIAGLGLSRRHSSPVRAKRVSYISIGLIATSILWTAYHHNSSIIFTILVISLMGFHINGITLRRIRKNEAERARQPR